MKIVVKMWPAREGIYRAVVPALPGCSAEGESWEEARRLIEQAVRSYLSGLNVPEDQHPRELAVA